MLEVTHFGSIAHDRAPLQTLVRPGHDVLVLPSPSDAVVPWAGLRASLAALALLRGQEFVRAAVWPERVALSLVLRELTRLDAAELARREHMTPQPSGFMSHNAMLAVHLRMAWIDTLTRALAGLTVVLAEPGSWDAPSLHVLLAALQRSDDVALLLGPCDPLALDDTHERSRRRELLGVLERLRVSTASPRQCDASLPRASALPPVAPFDDALELRALSSDDVELGTAAMSAAFACFGYACAERLGQRTLARARELAPEQRRWLHRVVALSAYNLQVRTRGESPEADAELATRLEHHFRAALDGESDPAWRAHLLYRLCINQGRRRDRLHDALVLAEEAIDLASVHALPVERAWALNARAYLRARLGALPGAISDVSEAERLLATPLDPTHPLAGEQLASHLVMHENLAELHARAGEIETALRWESDKRVRARELPGRWQHGVRVYELLRRARRVREAIELAEQALATARAVFDPIAEDRLLAELAVLRYQAGDAAQAYADASAALVMFRRIGGTQEVAVELCAAMAALRCGRVEVLMLLEQVLGATTEAAARAELTATRGWALALHGQVDACEQAINEAIEQAVELGSAATLVRVACAAGEACLALGRHDDAAQAFTQARELASGLAPADRLIALVGWLHTHAESAPGELDDALSLLADALDEPEAWWELPRLAALVRARLGEDAPLPSVLAQVLAQRVS